MVETERIGRMPQGRFQGSTEDFGNFSGLGKTVWEAGPRRKIYICPSLRMGARRKGCLGQGFLEPLLIWEGSWRM